MRQIFIIITKQVFIKGYEEVLMEVLCLTIGLFIGGNFTFFMHGTSSLQRISTSLMVESKYRVRIISCPE